MPGSAAVRLPSHLRPPALSWQRRTHSDRPGPAAASVQLMLKREATDGRRALHFQRSRGDSVSRETQSRDSGLESLGPPGPPKLGPQLPPLEGPDSLQGCCLLRGRGLSRGVFGSTANHIKGAAPTSASTGTEGKPGMLPGRTRLSFSAGIFAKQGCVSSACLPLRLRNCDPERLSQDRAGHWLLTEGRDVGLMGRETQHGLCPSQ